jgi:hypothetical protein
VPESIKGVEEGKMVNCQLKDKNYYGNCEGCTKREFCMMSEILEKVQALEMKLTQMKAAQTA